MKPDSILRKYRTFTLRDKVYYLLRTAVAPFSDITEFIPRKGNVLDAGCGYGFLTHILAQTRPDCHITGIDINAKRVDKAAGSVTPGEHVAFIRGDLTRNIYRGTYAAIICFDLLHHIPKNAQYNVIMLLVEHLSPHGFLIVKEIDTAPKWKYACNYLHDFITSSGGKIYCRNSKKWQDIMVKNNLTVRHVSFPEKGYVYPHVLIVAQKNQHVRI
jgi:2-polyprenyl-3-methyl-5-hydroxy-6-metoxy-1,4-benzoquinol methylase